MASFCKRAEKKSDDGDGACDGEVNALKNEGNPVVKVEDSVKDSKVQDIDEEIFEAVCGIVHELEEETGLVLPLYEQSLKNIKEKHLIMLRCADCFKQIKLFPVSGSLKHNIRKHPMS